MRLRGRLWIRFLLVLVLLRLYVAVRRFLIWANIDADLLVECGDHYGETKFRDLPWLVHGHEVRPGTRDD